MSTFAVLLAIDTTVVEVKCISQAIAQFTLSQPCGLSKGIPVEFQLCMPVQTQWEPGKLVVHQVVASA
jgi:hypothetical protein